MKRRAAVSTAVVSRTRSWVVGVTFDQRCRRGPGPGGEVAAGFHGVGEIGGGRVLGHREAEILGGAHGCQIGGERAGVGVPAGRC